MSQICKLFAEEWKQENWMETRSAEDSSARNPSSCVGGIGDTKEFLESAKLRQVRRGRQENGMIWRAKLATKSCLTLPDSL